MLVLALLAACSGGPPDSDVDTDAPLGALALDPCDPGGFDFGALAVGGVGSATVRAENIGEAPLTLESVTIDAPFSTSAQGSQAIGPGSSVQFAVRLIPPGYGAWSADLQVVWSDGVGEAAEIRCTFTGRVDGDGDGDGFAGVTAGGDDCDDADPDVHPGGVDAWYDGIDGDCDGANDDDQDGDGYAASARDADPLTGGDCQDADPAIHPGATDVWYDGVDADCDGADDFDRDGDGWASAHVGGDDCDDVDESVFPDAIEAWNDADDDCNSAIDDEVSPSTAEVTLLGLTADRFGRSVALGDWDGDDRDELVVGAWHADPVAVVTGGEGTARGAVAVWMLGPEDGDRASGAVFAGATPTSEAGWTVANVGDWDGDQRDDLAIAAPAQAGKDGAVYLISGTRVGERDLTRSLAVVVGRTDQRLGLGVASQLDLDGDGRADLAVAGADPAAPYATLGVHYGGSPGGALAWSDLDAQLVHACGPATGASCETGWSAPAGGGHVFADNVRAAADLDGDGLDDLPLADPYDDAAAIQAGRVWVLWGRSVQYAGGASLEGTAGVVASGSASGDLLGTAVGVTPDADDDGADELWVTGGADGTGYRLATGPGLRRGVVDPAVQAVATLRSRHATGFYAGRSDPLVAFAREGRGVVRALPGPAIGALDDDAFGASIVGDERAGAFGTAVGRGDVDGDGRIDVVIGDPDANGGDGAVVVFR